MWFDACTSVYVHHTDLFAPSVAADLGSYFSVAGMFLQDWVERFVGFVTEFGRCYSLYPLLEHYSHMLKPK